MHFQSEFKTLPFYYTESSTIFEALEFGFGYDTEVGKAAISLEIQQNGKSMHFTHLKSIERGHFYRVKVNGENLKVGFACINFKHFSNCLHLQKNSFLYIFRMSTKRNTSND